MKDNECIDVILGRRSIRRFTDKAISHEDLETIVTCGQWAPSAINLQQWHFVIVNDVSHIEHIAQVLGTANGIDGYTMYHPAALIIVAHARDAQYGREDDGCAIQTMFLAAHSLGIGSVWLNQMNGHCDEPEVRALLGELSIANNEVVYGIAAFGYPAEPGTRFKRASTVTWIK
ncbi:MAG: nitroreductase family protein [Eggerthellaceae bacterium]|nr:nitroreductase family protein [Eggerthellaceae bacterium]MCH4221137.1 nitroreductase family protein [Eggerthellaceae bacterium]